MKLIEKVVPRDFNLFLSGDYHIGSSLCDIDGIKKMIDMMQKDYDGVSNNFIVLHGDAIEAITPDDPRFHFETTSTELSKPLQQAEAFVELFKPIRHKIIVNLIGNHCFKLVRNYGDLAEWISNKLNVEYGTYTSIITYRTDIGEVLFKQMATHGYGSSNSSADDPLRRETTMKLSLKKKLMEKQGDCKLMTMGHTHGLRVCEPTNKLFISSDKDSLKQNYTLDNKDGQGYIHPDDRYYVNTGSFYKLYGDNVSGYAERFGYNPLELGFCIAKIRDGKIAGVDKIVIG